MARPQKSLEEQLKNAKNELAKTLEKEQSLREKLPTSRLQLKIETCMNITLY